MEYTAIDLFAESATAVADLFNEADENDAANEKKEVNEISKAIQILAKTAKADIDKKLEKFKQYADDVKKALKRKQSSAAITQALKTAYNDYTAAIKSVVDSAEYKKLASAAKSAKEAAKISEKDITDLPKALVGSLKTVSEKGKALKKEYVKFARGVAKVSEIIKTEPLDKATKEVEQAEKELSTLDKIKKTITDNYNKVKEYVKGTKASTKAIVAVGTAIASYAVLVMMAKKLGYTGAVIDVVAVTKFIATVETTLGKKLILFVLGALVVAGIVYGGYQAYLAIKGYFAEKKPSK